MKFRKKPVVVDAKVYSRGLEDGYEYEDQLRVEPTLGMIEASIDTHGQKANVFSGPFTSIAAAILTMLMYSGLLWPKW